MNTPIFEIIQMDRDTLERYADDLCHVLTETVADGAAVSFLAPLGRADAERFWSRDVKAALGNGARLLFGAIVEGKIVGTVQLVVAMPPNQPHRAEISKMIVHPDHRRRGIGKGLLRCAF
ncbi:GNAT family N-acetyltransferase [Roseibacterium sp. SDUM158017]|uniref:GNAT family N-acetyltransferase n=1 Tax=Roseicyclus salinarum TaxID=3036773 RepID=UPI0024150864|nr:GNAT family N-acetyltransferase [Roseibacterium sp. SDUM158017]MDG4648671.1 GNAT family N-acetyltransferase [Roseibacterium sp. SDUM158017]